MSTCRRDEEMVTSENVLPFGLSTKKYHFEGGRYNILHTTLLRKLQI